MLDRAGDPSARDRTQACCDRAPTRTDEGLGDPSPLRPHLSCRAMIDRFAARLSKADRFILAVLAPVTLVLTLAPVANALQGDCRYDYNLWYVTGQNYLNQRPLYPHNVEFPFIYPPSAAAMFTLPTLLGKALFVLVLTIFNSVAWLISAGLTVWLVTGHFVRQRPALALLPTLTMAYWIRDTYKFGQPALVLLALMLGAAACLRRNMPVRAGILVGTAAAIKAYPVLAIAYLVYRRRWKATAVTLATLAIWLLLVPLAFRTPKIVVSDLVTWTRGVVLTYDTRRISQRGMHGYDYSNQSIVAVANRLLRSVPADAKADPCWTVNLANLDFGTVNAVILASLLALCLFYLWCMPPANCRTSRSDTVEWALLLLLIVMVAPLSFDYSYVWMLYPLGVATGLILRVESGFRPPQGLFWWFSASLLVLALALPMHHRAEAGGNVFFSALILFIGLGLALRQKTSGRQSSPASALGSSSLASAGPASRV